MRTKLYAVGNNIETSIYPSWFNKHFDPVTNVPVHKSDFDKETLTDSILDCKSVRFYLTEKEASQYACSKAEPHRYDGRFITCPVVFEVQMEINAKKQLQCTELKSALIHHSNSTSVSMSLDFPVNVVRLFSFISNKLDITQDNFADDLEELTNSIITRAGSFTFLCGNSRGFQPAGQNKIYQFPEEISQQIYDDAVGRKI